MLACFSFPREKLWRMLSAGPGLLLVHKAQHEFPDMLRHHWQEEKLVPTFWKAIYMINSRPQK